MTTSTVLTDYIAHGAAASRPATPNVASNCLALWYSTDTNELDGWTGSAWVALTIGAASWTAGPVAHLSTGLVISSTTLTASWQGGTVTSLGSGLSLNAGTIAARSQVPVTATVGVNALTIAAGTTSQLVNGPAGGGAVTLTCGSLAVDQSFKLIVKQGATAATWTLGTGFSFGAAPASYTATAVANQFDVLMVISNLGTIGDVMAISQGFTV